MSFKRTVANDLYVEFLVQNFEFSDEKKKNLHLAAVENTQKCTTSLEQGSSVLIMNFQTAD